MKIINCQEYKNICDYDLSTEIKLPKSGIVYCPLDNISKFFKLIENSDNKYTVVSAASDYSLVYQAEHSVEKDMVKWLKMSNFDGMKYSPLIMPTRCYLENCKIDDVYSIKVYSFTKDTFDKIPDNVVKWYCTNADIANKKLVRIPFGVADWANDIELYKRPLEDKESKVYVNFQNNTNERLHIKLYCHHNLPWCSVINKEKPHKEYFEDITNHKFVLCPPGNGFDCYRIWESLYVGSIPIVWRSRWSMFGNLPMIKINQIEDLTEELLIREYETIREKLQNNEYNMELINMEYWQQEIKNA